MREIRPSGSEGGGAGTALPTLSFDAPNHAIFTVSVRSAVQTAEAASGCGVSSGIALLPRFASFGGSCCDEYGPRIDI
jgi:hypothetical protein